MRAANGKSPSVDSVLRETLYVLFDLTVQLFINARNRYQDIWTHFEKSLGKGFDLRAIRECHSPIEKRKIGMAGGHMGQRQERNTGHARANVETSQRVLDVGSEVAVSQHHAFWRAGGAGGIDDGSQIVWGDSIWTAATSAVTSNDGSAMNAIWSKNATFAASTPAAESTQTKGEK